VAWLGDGQVTWKHGTWHFPVVLEIGKRQEAHLQMTTKMTKILPQKM